MALHQAGDLEQAAHCYTEILRAQPARFDALHYLGLLEAQRERYGEALSLLDRAREHVCLTHEPSGYNIGINEGSAAGQNPFLHLNVHLIPRFPGDSEDPRGGVRWVIPNRADYWSQR